MNRQHTCASDGSFVVLALATARSGWFTELGRLAAGGAAPVDVVRCMSVPEVVARLASTTPHSALVVDAAVNGIDRDLIDHAHRRGTVVVVVGSSRARRDWPALGAVALEPGSGAGDVVEAVLAHAAPVQRAAAVLPGPGPVDVPGGALVAVTGPGGAGTSTVAMGIAQALGTAGHGAPDGGLGAVLLADCRLDADLAHLHAAPDVVPGLPELVEAHRTGAPGPDAVASVLFDVDDRGYHLLLGLRRHRDWAALRPRAVAAALTTMRTSYAWVVADVDSDIEGHDECGSVEVEERNVLARTVLGAASVVVVVGDASCAGLHRLGRTAATLAEHLGGADRLLAVANRAPRTPVARAAAARAVATCCHGGDGSGPTVVFAPAQRRLDTAQRDGAPLPAGWCTPLGRAVEAAVARLGALDGTEDGPEAVRPGSLGAWGPGVAS